MYLIPGLSQRVIRAVTERAQVGSELGSANGACSTRPAALCTAGMLLHLSTCSKSLLTLAFHARAVLQVSLISKQTRRGLAKH